MRTTARLWGALFVLGAVCVGTILACMFPEFAPQFVNRGSPGGSLTAYFRGSLGVVEPSFHHLYLFGAYRRLNGLATEATALIPESSAGQSGQPATQLWDEARARVRGGRSEDTAPSSDRQYRELPSGSGQFSVYGYFLNCPDDAYRHAASVLSQRVEQFGASSQEVGLWLEGQETVFSNCGGGEAIPSELAAAVHPLIRADREYQIAAAHFYAGHFEEAARRFDRIAGSSDSPWREWGSYLAARAALRRGMLLSEPGQFDRRALEEASGRLADVLADPSLDRVHGPARKLQDFVRLRLDPEERFRELAQRLVTPSEGSLEQEWIDYDYLLDRGYASSSEDDLSRWMTVFRGGEEPQEKAVEQWRRSGASHWLMASLAHIDSRHESLSPLLEAAARVAPQSPAYPTVVFHRARLLIENGRPDEARLDLDALFAQDLPLPPASRNRLRGLRLQAAADFADFLRFVPRQPVGGYLGPSSAPDALYPDEDALYLFNEALPLRLWEQAILDPALPSPIQRELSLAAWVRAALLGEEEIAARLSEPLRRYWPELRAEVEEYEALADQQARRFALIFLLLRHPGLRPHLIQSAHRETPLEKIDDLRENWWCVFDVGEPMHEHGYWKRAHLQDRRLSPDFNHHPAPPVAAPAFLTEAERRQAEDELRRLRAIPTAPNFLCAETLRWARSRPEDPRVPQALHLAVRSTRYGCEDENTTRFSRECFQLLHRRYPDSEWARATKYWY